MKTSIAVFDFDGTLTTKDTFIEFIIFTKGKLLFYWGLLLFSPILMGYKLGIYPNWRAKEKLFSFFFKDMKYSTFKKYGIKFADEILKFENKYIVEKLMEYIKSGIKVYIISASIEEWIIPWCKNKGNITVIGTKIKIEKDKIVGKFSTPNCYGKEKVIRLLNFEPNRDSYILHAFGDSLGDKELLEYADVAFKINRENT